MDSLEQQSESGAGVANNGMSGRCGTVECIPAGDCATETYIAGWQGAGRPDRWNLDRQLAGVQRIKGRTG